MIVFLWVVPFFYPFISRVLKSRDSKLYLYLLFIIIILLFPVCSSVSSNTTHHPLSLSIHSHPFLTDRPNWFIISRIPNEITIGQDSGLEADMRNYLTFDRDDVGSSLTASQCQIPTLGASDGEHFSVCNSEDMKLIQNTQECQDNYGNLQSLLNVKNDPFILKLPPEIASHILFSSMDAASYDRVDKLPTALLLGSICRGWRLLARSTPELWSTLSFSLGKPMKPGRLSQLQAVSDWLQLSGGLPLTLRVFEYFGTGSVSQEECDPIIDILNQHSERWHKLFLYLPAKFFHLFFGTSPRNILYKLHLVGDRLGLSATFKMRSRPSPAHLGISYCPISALDIGWENLTSLKLTHAIFDGCIEVIQQAPLLEYCSIELSWLKSSYTPKMTVRHMRLRTLRLLQFPPKLLRSFLDVLELPALEAYCTQGGHIAVDNVISLLHRSGVCLKRLILIMHSPHTENIKKLLDAVPHLQDLCLNFFPTIDASITHELFEYLSLSPPILVGNVPGFLPSLQSLKIFAWGISLWPSIPHLFSWPHRKLLRLEVYKMDHVIRIDSDTLHRILSLVDEGINIRIFQVEGLRETDYLQEFKETFREAYLSEVPEVVDDALEGI